MDLINTFMLKHFVHTSFDVSERGTEEKNVVVRKKRKSVSENIEIRLKTTF